MGKKRGQRRLKQQQESHQVRCLGNRVFPSLFQNDTCSILRIFRVEGLNPRQKIFAHMGEDESSAPQCRSVCIERLVVEVVFHLLIEEVGLADEKVGTMRSGEQFIGPLRVARVGNDFSIALDS